jgi:hypothetical protein
MSQKGANAKSGYTLPTAQNLMRELLWNHFITLFFGVRKPWMCIFKELESFSVVALSDVELGNNQRQTLLQISLVLLLNQVNNLEQGSRSCVPCSEHFWRCAFIRVSLVTLQIWSLKWEDVSPHHPLFGTKIRNFKVIISKFR